MGVNTTICAYDYLRFHLLSGAIDDVRASCDSRRLSVLIGLKLACKTSSVSFLERLMGDGTLAARIDSSHREAVDFFAPLFFRFCSPVHLGFTSSLFCRYLYKRSPYLERLFTVEGFRVGPSMEAFFGPGERSGCLPI